jgi:hydroxyacylglutathione hydrolase
MTAWRSEDRAVERVAAISADQLDGPELEAALVLDVRGEDEYARGHVEGALNIPYGELLDRIDELPRDRPIATLCSGGKRSGLAASILQREGFEQVIHVTSEAG